MNYGISVLFRAIPLLMALFWLRSFRARHGNRPGQVRCRPGSDVIGNDMHRLVRDGGNHYPADNPHV